MRSAAWISFVAALLCLSCSRSVKVLEPASCRPGIARLVEGEGTREAMIAELGAPDARFEEGRLVVWHLNRRQRPIALERYRSDWKRLAATRLHLVVEFDDEGRVVRNALIRVR